MVMVLVILAFSVTAFVADATMKKKKWGTEIFFSLVCVLIKRERNGKIHVKL